MYIVLVQSPDENAMKTEFTFEPSMLMGSTPVGSPTIGNPRKRKFDGDSVRTFGGFLVLVFEIEIIF